LYRDYVLELDKSTVMNGSGFFYLKTLLKSTLITLKGTNIRRKKGGIQRMSKMSPDMLVKNITKSLIARQMTDTIRRFFSFCFSVAIRFIKFYE